MSVSFAAVAQSGTNPVTYYHWDFGDGGSAGGQNAQHTFAAAGSYSVTSSPPTRRATGARTRCWWC